MDRPIKKILWVDDDIYLIYPLIQKLKDEGYEVITAGTVSAAKAAVETNDIAAVITDIMLPLGDTIEDVSYKGGFESGLVLGRWIKSHYPLIPVIGFSVVRDPNVTEWFEHRGDGYFAKSSTSIFSVLHQVKAIVEGGKPQRTFRVFLVHGHDNDIKEEARTVIRDVLHLGEPIVLNEQPSFNRTIIEKFERITNDIDLVFVLLTPDDQALPIGAAPAYRSRQNVILELGYFLGKLGRESGRILLLHKGDVELPSDIDGVIRIDISNGVHAAADLIRRELRDLIS